MATTSIGRKLREHVEDIIDRYVTRLRKDPAIPHGSGQARPLLEDHAMTFLGDIFQTVGVLEEQNNDAVGEEEVLLKDGTEIQLLIADLHGRQRHRLGWPESAVTRDYEIMAEEVEASARKQAGEHEGEQIAFAMDVVGRLLARATEASLRAYREA